MSTNARKRLMKDMKEIRGKGEEDGVYAEPNPDNIMSWKGIIRGPEGTPYEGGVFQVEISFTEEFPFSSPRVRFVSRMFHPNIYADGNICLDILSSRWSPSLTVHGLLISIRSLLHDPNPSSPANGDAASLFRNSKEKYTEEVKKTVMETLER
ncbi:MAG: ubiquitin conjugating enzyme E2 [Amphiamblys sp. WSBS2006]|nr:MAG: ubiquitin conjugating enzyme E2 [Amphiamblys sp. WSBS2006]